MKFKDKLTSCANIGPIYFFSNEYALKSAGQSAIFTTDFHGEWTVNLIALSH